jgi:hypothetical protein
MAIRMTDLPAAVQHHLRALVDVQGPEAEKPTSKYRAKRTEYGGRMYDSRAEASYAQQLDLARQAGQVLWWLPQPTFRLDVLTYRADFLVLGYQEFLLVDRQGRDFAVNSLVAAEVYAVDVKGATPPRWRDIRKLWVAHGPFPLRVVRRNQVAEILVPTACQGSDFPTVV